ncbi:hypothetical protein ABZP36_006895 [Zizania latifolia]
MRGIKNSTPAQRVSFPGAGQVAHPRSAGSTRSKPLLAPLAFPPSRWRWRSSLLPPRGDEIDAARGTDDDGLTSPVGFTGRGRHRCGFGAGILLLAAGAGSWLLVEFRLLKKWNLSKDSLSSTSPLMGNPARANRIQMAQAAAATFAAAAVHATDQDDPQLDLTAVVPQPEVQDAGLSDDADSGQGSSVTSVSRMGVDSGKSAEDGGSERDLKCLECGKVFLSDKAMYGHQKAHRKRDSKAATRPATADNALLDGDKQRPRRVSRCEAELPAWPQITTGRRGRPPSSASTAGSVSAPAHQDIMTAEEAAMILLDMKSGRRRPLELEQGIQPAHVADAQPEAVHRMPRVERPLPPEHHAVATHHVPEVLQPSVPDYFTGADEG